MLLGGRGRVGDRLVTEWHKSETTEWITVASHQFASCVSIDGNVVAAERYF